MNFRSLPPEWDGLRIVFIADLHFGEAVSLLDRKVMNLLEAEPPDILILGGDNVNRYENWPSAVDWFRKFPARLAKIAVPGNWEYKYDNSIGGFRYYMQKAGFIPLCNESFWLERDGCRLPVVGFDDVRHGFIDIEQAYQGVVDASFILAVSHSPDILIHLQPERFNLLLCGHTHGGQVRVPGYGAITTSTKLGKKYEVGAYHLGDEHEMYISRGVGTGDFHWRIFCPPEVVMVTLQSSR